MSRETRSLRSCSCNVRVHRAAKIRGGMLPSYTHTHTRTRQLNLDNEGEGVEERAADSLREMNPAFARAIATNKRPGGSLRAIRIRVRARTSPLEPCQGRSHGSRRPSAHADDPLANWIRVTGSVIRRQALGSFGIPARARDCFRQQRSLLADYAENYDCSSSEER